MPQGVRGEVKVVLEFVPPPSLVNVEVVVEVEVEVEAEGIFNLLVLIILG